MRAPIVLDVESSLPADVTLRDQRRARVAVRPQRPLDRFKAGLYSGRRAYVSPSPLQRGMRP